MFPQAFIDDVRSHADIVQVVQEYVTLRKSGATYKGLCPFHSEKTPSFHVNHDKGFFHCFGCSADGDVFKFLELQEKRGLANHHDIGIQHNDLGVVLTEAGRYPAAESEFKTSLQKWEKHWPMPMQTEDYAATLHNYAVLLQKMGRAADAKAMEDKGVKIMAERRRALGM